MKPRDGRNRVVIEEVAPQIDGGRYPVCRIVGDEVMVAAAIFADGHDHLAARLLYRHEAERKWRFAPMAETGNDLWAGSFKVDKLGLWRFTVEGWIEHFDSWVSELRKRLLAQPHEGSEPNDGRAVSGDIPLALRAGAVLIREAASRARGTDAKRLGKIAESLELLAKEDAVRYEDPITAEIQLLVARYPDLTHATRLAVELPVRVDRELARFSAWYEMFPRSASMVPGSMGASPMWSGSYRRLRRWASIFCICRPSIQ